MAEMSPLRRRMIEDMKIRNLSPATQRCYVHKVAKFSRYFTLADKVNLPCASPGPSCNRAIVDIVGVGTYTVDPDGTGVATFAFKNADGTNIGTEDYDFVITAATRNGRKLLATQVFAADRSGGLARQLVAPTWSRVSD